MQKDRFKQWESLADSVSGASKELPPIRMIELPQIETFELALIANPPRARQGYHPAADQAEVVAEAVFGITIDATYSTVPEHYFSDDTSQEEIDRIEREEDRYEERFMTKNMDDQALVDFFLERGMDFRDDRGHPLRCTIYLRRPAEMAARRWKGHIPDRSVIGLRKTEAEMKMMEQKLKAEAERFRLSRRKAG